jgi:hypothetical protein
MLYSTGRAKLSKNKTKGKNKDTNKTKGTTKKTVTYMSQNEATICALC